MTTTQPPLPDMPDNPEFTDGFAQIPRRADPLRRMLMDDFDKTWQKIFGASAEPLERHPVLLNRAVDVFAQIYLLGVLRSTDAAVADKAAAALADQWDAGDSLGEWVYQWRQELDAGRPMTLLFEDEPADVAPRLAKDAAEIERLRAELATAVRQRASLARRLGIRFENEQRLSAELATAREDLAKEQRERLRHQHRAQFEGGEVTRLRFAIGDLIAERNEAREAAAVNRGPAEPEGPNQ